MGGDDASGATVSLDPIRAVNRAARHEAPGPENVYSRSRIPQQHLNDKQAEFLDPTTADRYRDDQEHLRS